MTIPLLLLCSSCSIGYVVKQGAHQIGIALASRDIGKMLEDPKVPEREKSALRLVLDVKEFAERELRLFRSRNYTIFYDTGGEPVSYVVSACRDDRFEPHIWSFFIVGDVPYKGFFNLQDAVAEKKRLEGEGYDAALHPVAAYSTLGWFKDPVFSPMLRYPRDRLANVIIHELVHGTIYAKGQGAFNESLASFIAKKGTLRYFEEREGGLSPERIRALKEYDEDERRFIAFVESLSDRLAATYASEKTRAQKLEEKRVILDAARGGIAALTKTMKTRSFDHYAEIEFNNAEILAMRRYNRDDLYEPVYDRVGGCMPCFLRVMRRAAESGDPVKYLEEKAWNPGREFPMPSGGS